MTNALHRENPLPERTDKELLEAIAYHDDSAMEELYQRYAARLFGFFRWAWGCQEADARDLVHETMIAAIESASRYDPTKGSVKTWLLTIGRRKMISRYRKQREEPGLEVETVQASDLTPVKGLEYYEEVELMRGIIDRLDPDLRKVLLAENRRLEDLDRIKTVARDVCQLWDALSDSLPPNDARKQLRRDVYDLVDEAKNEAKKVLTKERTAQELGLTLDQYNGRLSRARKALREMFSKRFTDSRRIKRKKSYAPLPFGIIHGE